MLINHLNLNKLLYNYIIIIDYYNKSLYNKDFDIILVN